MEMKLSGTRIRELRIKQSWSQEKLAEQAGLNPRTVQRAESEGSASLRTRLQLAQALQVLPEDLDAEQAELAGTPDADHAPTQTDTSIHYLTVVLLVSLIYLAAQPAYFSASFTNFSWVYPPSQQAGLWLVISTLIWALTALPLIWFLAKKHRPLVRPWRAACYVALGLTALRIWEPASDLIADVLTAVVSISGLALLVSLYLPRLDTNLLRHVVFMCLGVYLFLWFFNDVISFIANTWMFIESGKPLSEVAPAWYIASRLMESAGNLIQLIPIGLVVALSLARRPQWPTRAGRRTQTSPPPLSST